jgi:hypothetical protein
MTEARRWRIYKTMIYDSSGKKNELMDISKYQYFYDFIHNGNNFFSSLS